MDGVGGGDEAEEVVKEGFAVDEGDGGDGFGGFHVVGVLEVVVLEEVDEGFEGEEVAELGAVGGGGGGGEGVGGAEAELVVDSGDAVEIAAYGVVAEDREWIHCWRERVRGREREQWWLGRGSSPSRTEKFCESNSSPFLLTN